MFCVFGIGLNGDVKLFACIFDEGLQGFDRHFESDNLFVVFDVVVIRFFVLRVDVILHALLVVLEMFDAPLELARLFAGGDEIYDGRLRVRHLCDKSATNGRLDGRKMRQASNIFGMDDAESGSSSYEGRPVDAANTKYSRDHWERLCIANDFGWLLEHSTWRRFWDPACKRKGDPQYRKWVWFLEEDPQGRAFVFYGHEKYCKSTWHIYAVLTDEVHRNQGIISKLLDNIFEKQNLSPRMLLTLEAKTGKSANFWYRRGFSRTKLEYQASQYSPGNYIWKMSYDWSRWLRKGRNTHMFHFNYGVRVHN